ncbi:hypothetical protein H8356DRAFT_1417262 [Neocallimastix lanati (nom. inval.)]|nr:hypothetical protein H8356DRAFT_1417262 [Neocallimastix sp. JGI-2020a]
MPFLVRSTALFTEIMPRASTRQGLLFRKYKRKLTRSVNAENAVRQASRTNASEGEDHNFFQIGTLKEEIIISLYLIEVFSNGNSFTFLYCVSKELNIPPLSAKCPIAQEKYHVVDVIHRIKKRYGRGNQSMAKTYNKKNKFEKKKNFKYPEFRIGFQWVLQARCGYKFYIRVAKASKIIKDDYPSQILILIVYNVNNNNNRNNIFNNSRINDSKNRNINISESENYSIVTNNVVNSSIDKNHVNLSNFQNNEDADINDLNFKISKRSNQYLRKISINGPHKDNVNSHRIIVNECLKIKERQDIVLTVGLSVVTQVGYGPFRHKCNFPAQVLSWNIFIRESTFRCLVSLFPYRYILLGDVDSLLNCNLSDIYVFTKEVGKLEKHSEKKRTRKFSAIICMFECHCFILSKAVHVVTTSILPQ